MLNHDHTSPPKTAKIYRLTITCPTCEGHTMYLTLAEDDRIAAGFLNWLGAQIAAATGARVYADLVVEADLDELPF